MTEDIGPWGLRVKALEDQWFIDAQQGVKDTYVYRYFDADSRLLYVGQTNSPKRRDSAHKSRAPWFDLVATRELRGPVTKAWALLEEFVALGLESPAYNTQARNGHTGPGSDHWAIAMSEKFRELMVSEPEVWAGEYDAMARRMGDLFAEHDTALLESP